MKGKYRFKDENLEVNKNSNNLLSELALETKSLAPMGTASFFFGGLVAYETAEKKI